MTKGARIEQFSVGQLVYFTGGRGIPGRIVKLHPLAGRNGSAEIKPTGGSAKVTRRLQYVTRAT